MKTRRLRSCKPATLSTRRKPTQRRIQRIVLRDERKRKKRKKERRKRSTGWVFPIMASAILDHKKLLLVFVHGFASSDTTFEDFPEHLRTVLSNSLCCDVEAVIYPTYATTGIFSKAVDEFCEWLLKLTEERLNGTEKHEEQECYTVILGHSMGGLLAADSIIKLQEGTLHKHKVLGLIAFDSPFYGVNRRVISQTAASRASEATSGYTQGLSALSAAYTAFSATKAGSRSTELVKKTAFSKWGLAATGVAVGGALLGAYAGRKQLTKGFQFLHGHLEFASALIKQGELKNRVETIQGTTDLKFQCFYNEVEFKASKFGKTEMRTFIELPPPEQARYFTKLHMNSDDEIDAHMNMFCPTLRSELDKKSTAAETTKPNSAYYSLAGQTMRGIIEMVESVDATLVRGPFLDSGTPSESSLIEASKNVDESKREEVSETSISEAASVQNDRRSERDGADAEGAPSIGGSEDVRTNDAEENQLPLG